MRRKHFSKYFKEIRGEMRKISVYFDLENNTKR